MSLIYKLARPAAKWIARRQLEEGMKDPSSYMQKVKALQRKALPIDRLHQTYDFERKKADGTVYYRIHSRKEAGKRVILYFHGGGYLRPLKPEDFEFGEEMADETGADVWLVCYALFPDATGKDIAQSAVDVYREALREYKAEDISFYGNSSGGALCFTACVYLKKYLPDVPLPGRIVSHSPSIRIPTSREEQRTMDLLDRLDVVIPAGYVNMYIQRPDLFRTGGFEEFASPLDTDWSGFPRTLVVFGSDEVFLAYLPGIIRKCREDQVELETYVGKGCHCFSAKGIFPESHTGRERIYSFLRGERKPWETVSEDILGELKRNQKGELDAVIMYRMLADRMESGQTADALKRLAGDELRHAGVFRNITRTRSRPGRLQGDLICLLYRILGKERLFLLMARGEYAAVERYAALTVLYSQLERVRQDEKKHGDVLTGLAAQPDSGERKRESN